MSSTQLPADQATTAGPPAVPDVVLAEPVASTSKAVAPNPPTPVLVSKRISERLVSMQHTASVPSNQFHVPSGSGVCDFKNASAESLDDLAHRRRSSSRSIKRKKFDDELVDSMSTSYPKQQKPKSEHELRSGAGIEIVDGESSTVIEEMPRPIEPPPIPVVNNSSMKKLKAPSTSTSSSKKKSNKSRQVVSTQKYSENSSYWKPTDDLALIINVEQTNDLAKVHQGVKFSCKFSYADIEARWHSLLYDYNAKCLALAAIRQLHADVVNLIQSKALFSEAEEALLKKIESRSEPSFETLQNLVNANAEIFLPSRTPKILLKHWLLLRHYQLLTDQTLQPLPRHESAVSFSEIEKIVQKELEEELRTPATSSQAAAASNEVVNQEITSGIRKSMLEIRMLENEIPKYQHLLDSITGIAPSDFDNQTYAVLRGRLVRYLMRSKEITIGRTTKDLVVDVDLSLEGPSSKISRLQAIVSLQPTGEFVIYNTGKRPLYVDSKPLLTETSLRVNNNSLIEFSTLKFIFLINQDLINNLRNEALQTLK